MTEPILPPLKPIPIKDRLSVLFIEKGNLDVLDGAFVIVDKTGVRTHVPVGGVACLMLEPGTRVSHNAVVLASRVGCLLVWIGEAGVRLYASGQPGGARADRLLYQAKLALDDTARLKVVRKMYTLRFGEAPALPPRVVLDLVAAHAPDAEVRGVGVREVPPAHRGPRQPLPISAGEESRTIPKTGCATKQFMHATAALLQRRQQAFTSRKRYSIALKPGAHRYVRCCCMSDMEHFSPCAAKT